MKKIYEFHISVLLFLNGVWPKESHVLSKCSTTDVILQPLCQKFYNLYPYGSQHFPFHSNYITPKCAIQIGLAFDFSYLFES